MTTSVWRLTRVLVEAAFQGVVAFQVAVAFLGGAERACREATYRGAWVAMPCLEVGMASRRAGASWGNQEGEGWGLRK